MEKKNIQVFFSLNFKFIYWQLQKSANRQYTGRKRPLVH